MESLPSADPGLVPDLRQDLQFVRAAIERGENHEGPAIIYWLWGVVTFFGFALNDYVPRWDGLYWAIVGPSAGVASWLILRRLLRRYGVSDRRETTREWLQWVGMAAAIVILGFDAHRSKIDGSTLGQLILLIVGYTYFLTYVRRGDRVMLASGLLMIGGSVAMVFVTSHMWTIMGARYSSPLRVVPHSRSSRGSARSSAQRMRKADA
jgi:hypothetical protein